MFVHAGEVQEHVSGPGPHNDDNGTDGGGEGGAEREETLVVRMSTELWWPIQLSRPLERSRMHGRCHVHIFWLDRDVATEELRWRLLGERECVVYYDNLLIDPSNGQPFVIRADAMRSGWDEDANITYELAPELCERLDAAAEARLCGEPGGSLTDEDEDEAPDEPDAEPEGQLDGDGEPSGRRPPTDREEARQKLEAAERERRNRRTEHHQMTLRDMLGGEQQAAGQQHTHYS